MKKTLFLIATFVYLAFGVHAEYTQTCKIKYKISEGWSDYYKVEVHFLSGTELNKKTNSYNYNSYSVYAVVFWDKGRSSVIELSTYMGCSSEVDLGCITNKYSNLEGKDQENRDWEICPKANCY